MLLKYDSSCCSPHGLHCILHILINMPPHAALLMVFSAFSTCLKACLLMLLSSRFALHSPHALNHASLCCSPHGLHCILHMLKIMPPYAVLLMLPFACLLMVQTVYHKQWPNHEDTLCQSVRTHGCVLMVSDIWFWTILLMVQTCSSSRFVLMLKSMRTNLLSETIRRNT